MNHETKTTWTFTSQMMWMWRPSESDQCYHSRRTDTLPLMSFICGYLLLLIRRSESNIPTDCQEQSEGCSQVSEGKPGLAQSQDLWLRPGSSLFWSELSPGCSDIWGQITGSQRECEERKREGTTCLSFILLCRDHAASDCSLSPLTFHMFPPYYKWTVSFLWGVCVYRPCAGN